MEASRSPLPGLQEGVRGDLGDCFCVRRGGMLGGAGNTIGVASATSDLGALGPDSSLLRDSPCVQCRV